MSKDKDSSSHDQEVIKILGDLESRKAEYPPELMAARRAAFMEQVKKRTAPAEGEELTRESQQVVDLLKKWKFAEPDYPSLLLAQRRSAFRQRAAQVGQGNAWSALRSSLRKTLAYLTTSSRMPSIKTASVSITAFGIVMAVMVAFAVFGNRNLLSNLSPDPYAVPFTGPIVVGATSTAQAAIICKEGYEPPLCLAKEFNKSLDLTYAGNGSARPAVAKDTIPGYDKVHDAAYLNDGLYGPGASWISNSPNSWIKIDLGKAMAMNTVAFGRDRLGKYNDRDPGQFVISVAASDNVYADGNSSNDEVEYTVVYNSEQTGFDGIISGAETVIAQFDLLEARFIKITFENAGTAIDEVEVFVAEPVFHPVDPTRTARENFPAIPPTATSTPLPSPTATPLPTDTPLPSETPTQIPTETPFPTDTPTPVPTDTPYPTDIIFPLVTEEPLPTNTPGPDEISHLGTLDILQD